MTHHPETGQPVPLAAGLRRILAPNPSPMTLHGTNTYLIGARDIAVIDPGPDSAPHFDAIMAALRPGQAISHIFVTHSHKDHSPLARRLSDATGAPVHAFGPSDAGRSPVMRALAQGDEIGGGEGVDVDFHPDVALAHGAEITNGEWTLTALWTPGHMGNHLCFAWGDALFTGDIVMGWASSLVSPPDGDLTQFMQSCHALERRADRIYYPGHGDPVADPAPRLRWLIDHRHARESQILAALATDARDIPALTAGIYHTLPAPLLPAAERNVFAHLIDLHSRDIVAATPALSRHARFTRK